MTAVQTSLRVLADVEALSHAAAIEFVHIAQGAMAARGRFLVALAGGFTPRLLYQLLTHKPYYKQVDWPHVEFFWSDERPVPPEHPDSNFGLARENLLRPLAIAPNQIHRIEAERSDRDEAAHAYQLELARNCGVDASGNPPALDLILLGLGTDGHVASLFPYTPALEETTRWITANYDHRHDVDRVTMTPPLINQAAHVMFLVAGPDKATALAHVLDGPEDIERFPGQLIRPTAGMLEWLVDEAAARKVKNTRI